MRPRVPLTPPPPLPWSASAQHELTCQRPDPNASQAKQAPLSPPCCPGPQACSANQRISGLTPTQAKQSERRPPPCRRRCCCRCHRHPRMRRRNALTLPLLPPCCHRPNNSADVRCHFCVWEWVGEASYLVKQGVLFFLKVELIRLYIRRVKQFSFFSRKMYHIEFLSCWPLFLAPLPRLHGTTGIFLFMC
jgi:hypothetical protein